MKIYDLIIIGSGPAGLTAGLYSSRYNMNVLILGAKEGGTITDAHKVCNFPTQSEIKGSKLGEKMKSHAEKYGAKVNMEKVTSIEEGNEFVLKTNLGNAYKAGRILLATGSKRRKLNLPKEDEFLGNGVSYCATCDGKFFEGQKVAVIGGSNAAATAALYLSDLAEKVYIIYRRDNLRAVSAWKEEIKNTDNIEVIYNNIVKKLEGKESLEAIYLNDKYKDSSKLKVDGLFIEIGSVPNNKLAKELSLNLDGKGHIKVGKNQLTNRTSVWAAGDVTNASNYFKQVIVSSAEGAVAANSIYTDYKSN